MKSIVFYKAGNRYILDIRSWSIYWWLRPHGELVSIGRVKRSGSAWVRVGRLEIFKHPAPREEMNEITKQS